MPEIEGPILILIWLVIIILALYLLTILAGVVGVLAIGGKEWRALRRKTRRRKRAEKGKVNCEYLIKGAFDHKDRVYCTNRATRSGAGGYTCEEHIFKMSQKGSVSFSRPLKWAQAEIERKRAEGRS